LVSGCFPTSKPQALLLQQLAGHLKGTTDTWSIMVASWVWIDNATAATVKPNHRSILVFFA
jgi:hypothetical protein